MAEKAKTVAIEEAERIKSLTVTAARSGAYLYPLRVSWPALPMAHSWLRAVWRTGFTDRPFVGHRILLVTP